MADGDLSSIFRHHQQYQQQQPADQWGSSTSGAMAVPMQQHAIPASSDSDIRWDYPNSLSPQSPFEYVDHQYQRAMQQSKSYSSLRPPALGGGHQGQFQPAAVIPDGSVALSRKRDYQGSNFQLREKVATTGSSFTHAPGGENLGVDSGSHGGLFTECKVDELATELESEILGDLRPGPGYLADHYPGRLLDPSAMAGGGVGVAMATQGGTGNLEAGTMIKVLNTAGSVKGNSALDGPMGKTGGGMNQSSNSATGLQLVHLLLACAEAVANEQMDLAQVVLARLSAMLVPCSTTMQRLGAVFVDALHARITNTATSGRYKGLENNSDVAILDMLQSFSVIYEFTPFIKLPHLTLNQIILDAVEGEAHVHVVDLNTAWRGMQWPAFIQALALRPGGPPKLRITSIGRTEDLEHSREKLMDYARNLQVPFEYCPIVTELRSFDVRMLDIRDWEVLCINAVNQFHTLLAWGADFFHSFLCQLRTLQPRVLAFTENDADHNSPTFLHRFFECLRYYSAVFDALDASLPQGSPALQQVEHLFTGQKIRNIVACEGEDRVTRHENLSNWSRRMELAGFRATPISTRAISQARLLLHLYFSQSGYTLRTENGAVVLGWDNMSLLGATAWRT